MNEAPIVAAVIGAGTAIALAILGAGWKLGTVLVARLSALETQGAVLTTRVDGIADDVSELRTRIERRLNGE